MKLFGPYRDLLGYISVISSICVNKFAQNCQHYYFFRPKRPTGNYYVPFLCTENPGLDSLIGDLMQNKPSRTDKVQFLSFKQGYNTNFTFVPMFTSQFRISIPL